MPAKKPLSQHACPCQMLWEGIPIGNVDRSTIILFVNLFRNSLSTLKAKHSLLWFPFCWSKKWCHIPEDCNLQRHHSEKTQDMCSLLCAQNHETRPYPQPMDPFQFLLLHFVNLLKYHSVTYAHFSHVILICTIHATSCTIILPY